MYLFVGTKQWQCHEFVFVLLKYLHLGLCRQSRKIMVYCLMTKRVQAPPLASCLSRTVVAVSFLMFNTLLYFMPILRSDRNFTSFLLPVWWWTYSPILTLMEFRFSGRNPHFHYSVDNLFVLRFSYFIQLVVLLQMIAFLF